MLSRTACAPLAALLVLTAGPLRAEPATAPAPSRPTIRPANYQEGQIVRHPVPLIRGELDDAGLTTVTAVNTTSDRPTREINGLAHRGRFKVLTELLPGENRLLIRAGKAEVPLTLIYRPQTTRYIVRCIYLTDNSGNTAYQSPLENDPQDYAAKLDTAMKLLQTFTAERNYDLGFGRRTFKLELDSGGRVKVHLFKCAEEAEHYYALEDGEWWGRMAQELEEKHPTRFGKNVAIAAYTRFDPATGKARGHTALGGGGLALFGSGNLFTWPSRLQDVQSAFMDARVLDPAKVFSDSAFRHTHWGAASTTMGATLHELAHTFGLPHTREPMDIMTRGFDQFNRVFTFMDPPSAGRSEPFEFPDDEVACFPPISATALLPCRWFAMSERSFDERGTTTIRLDDAHEQVVVSADLALAYVGISVKGDAVYHLVPPADAGRVVVPLADFRKHLDGDEFEVRVIDERGHVSVEKFSARPG